MKQPYQYLLMAIALIVLVWAIGFHPSTVSAQGGTVLIVTPADLIGDAAAHQLFPLGGTARWVSVIACGSTNCTATNAAPIRLGDSSTSATRGQPIAPGGSFFLPSMAADPREGVPEQLWNLSSLYYYAASGDKISVAWSK